MNAHEIIKDIERLNEELQETLGNMELDAEYDAMHEYFIDVYEATERLKTKLANLSHENHSDL